MKKSDAILIIETFTGKELRQFEDFLNSPFLNKNTKVIRFFNVLKKYHPNYPEDKISSHILYKELTGSEIHNSSYIRNLFSDLNILAEKFLQSIHISDEYHNEKYLISELNIRNISPALRKKLNLFDKKISQAKSRDQSYYSNKVFINNMKGLTLSDKTLIDVYNPEVISASIKLSLITVMENYFQFVVEEQRTRIKHNFDYLNHTLEYLRKNLKEFSDSPILLVYYYLWESFFDESGEEYFKKAKKIFDKNFSYFKLMDRKNIYAVMQTFCLKKTESGKDYFNKVLLNIMLEMLSRKVVSHREGIINLNLYRNVLIMCFRENETAMMRKFIHEYINLVNKESRESMLVYSNAHLNFLEGNFKMSLQLCNKINFTNLLNTTNENLFFKNDVRALTLRCMYELNSFESAIYQIDTYKHFLKNSELIKDSLRKKYMTYINIVSRLIKLKNNFDEYDLFKLKAQVLNSKDIVGKEWILKKINEFEK